MRRRVVLGSPEPLHISNRNSAEFDNFSSAAPPCYASQRDETSTMATIERFAATNDFDDEFDDDTSASMHSCPDGSLPSPHSTEDLPLAPDSGDEGFANPPTGPSSIGHTESLHGYTQTPPPISDTEPSSTPTPSGTTSSAQSPVPYHNRYARHASMPSSPYASYRGLPRTSETSPSPQPLYHGPATSQPADIGHLTHRHSQSCYEVYHDANEELASDDGERLNRAPPAMNSTVTFLPEGKNSSAPHLLVKPRPTTRPRGLNGDSASGAPPVGSAEVPSQPPSHDRATNYVSLSRKSTFKKPSFFSQAVVSSSITGKFTIDPSLYIPSSLLKAVESPGRRALDIAARSAAVRPPESKSPPGQDVAKSRQKNLSLEVENGGIDVDVHLVPSRKVPAQLNGAAQNFPGEAGGRRMPSIEYASATRLSLDQNYQYQRQRTRSSVDGHGYAYAPPSLQKYSAPQPPPPTLIDLRLKEMKGIIRKSSSTKQKNEFPLIARIHAPNPRPPFHLVASTVDMPASARPIPPALAGSSDAKPAAATGAPPPVVRVVARTRPIHMLPRSSLTLHLPRTFRGPLNVHVQAGDIDTHLRLSKGIVDASVVLAESAYSRGYFVGKLSELVDKEETDLGSDWALMNDEEELMSAEDTVRPSYRKGSHFEGMPAGMVIQSLERHGGSTSNDDDEVEKSTETNDEEWRGDKVDVHVGHGMVYLQYLGEENPFGKKGRFWGIIGRRHH